MPEEELAREAAALRAAGRAIEPYLDELRELKRQTRTIEENLREFRAFREEFRALREEVHSLRDDAARVAKYADDDRKRLAEVVKDEASDQASSIAKEVISQTLGLLQIKLEKADEFTKNMQFLRELRETFGSMRRHALLVLIGIVLLGITTAVWKAVTLGAKP